MKPAPHLLLSSRHRRSLWLGPLWVLVAGCVIQLALGWLGIGDTPRLAVLAAAVVAAAALRWSKRQSLPEVAQKLDEKLKAYNRLEAYAELHGRNDPVALAQRQETEIFVSHQAPPRTPAWPLGLALLAASVVLQSTIPELSLLNRPPSDAIATPKEETKAVPPKTADDAMPNASLRWVAPTADTTAKADEIVPLTAEAASGTGLQKLTLHLSLDGEPQPPIAVPAQIQAGLQSVEIPLDLAPLKAKGYQTVGYHLTAERLLPSGQTPPKQPWPIVASPLQFIQIEPQRDDLTTMPAQGGGGSGPFGQLLQLVKDLKSEQSDLIKRTFALAHDQPPSTGPESPGLLQQLAAEQLSLATQSARLTELAVQIPLPADGMPAVQDAQAALRKASASFEGGQATSVTPAQHLALARLTALEKSLEDMIKRLLEAKAAAPMPPLLAKPKKSEQSPVSRLQRLAREQRKLADELAQKTNEPNAFERQEKIRRELEGMAKESDVPAALLDGAKAALPHAVESARQLNERDPEAATQPAALAAQALEDALATLRTLDRKEAAKAIKAAQRALLRAAGETRRPQPEPAAKIVADTEQSLRTMAISEDEQGFPESAAVLSGLADAIATAEVDDGLAKLIAQKVTVANAETEKVAVKLEELAQKAADRLSQGEDGAEEKAEALQDLKKARANVDRAAQQGAESLEQLLDEAKADAQVAGGGANGLGAIPNDERAGGPQRFAQHIARRLDGVITLLSQAPQEKARTQVLTTGNPAEAPPAYRPAVSHYFEALSRGPAVVDPTSPPSSKGSGSGALPPKP